MICGVNYYPQWSARGMRAVQCRYPAKFTVVDPPWWSADHVCGTHARMARNHGGITVLDGIYDKKGAK